MDTERVAPELNTSATEADAAVALSHSAITCPRCGEVLIAHGKSGRVSSCPSECGSWIDGRPPAAEPDEDPDTGSDDTPPRTAHPPRPPSAGAADQLQQP